MSAHAVDIPPIYRIRIGETLSHLASRIAQPGQHVYHGPDGGVLAAILRLNPRIKNADFVVVGQEVILPTAQRVPSSVPPETSDPSVISEAPPAPTTESQNGFLGLRSEYLSSRLRARQIDNQASATLVSESHLGAALTYGQRWSDQFTTEFSLGLRKLNIRALSSTSTTLSGRSSTLKDFGAAATHRLSKNFAVGAGMFFSERVYLKGVSSTSITLDPLVVPSVLASGHYDLYALRRFSAGLRLGVGLDLPANASESAYKTRLNPLIRSALFVRHDVTRRFFGEVGLQSNWTRQNTTLVNQSQLDLGIYLGLHLPFGGDDQRGEAK